MINYIVVPPNKTVYFYSNYVLTNNLRIYDENKKFLGYQQKDKYTNEKDKNVYIRMRSTIPTELENDSLDKLKIIATYDNTTEYIPYQNQTINIDLKGNKLCAVSDTIKDKLLIDKNGNVALQKNVGKVIFNGNERWELAEKGFYNFSYFVGKKDKKNFEACCNYFLVEKSGKAWTGLNHCGFNNSGYFWIQEEHKLATTLGGFNEWLTTHNLEVYYALATPELIDLGQLPELPKTFGGINNIWAETNLGNTEIEIEYVQDVKKLLKKQDARLDNIEALLSTTETSALLLDNMQNDLEKEVK